MAGAGDRHPVVYVNSLEAMKFCQWLTTRERKQYRLPTEAEWEYAARGSDGGNTPGAITIAGAISRILPTRTRSSPGAIARSTMALRKAPPWALSLWARALWRGRHGWKCLGMVSGLFRNLPRRAEGESARCDLRSQAGLSRRELEIALQQPAHDHPGIERPQLFLQRSWLPHRLRMRLRMKNAATSQFWVLPERWPRDRGS